MTIRANHRLHQTSLMLTNILRINLPQNSRLQPPTRLLYNSKNNYIAMEQYTNTTTDLAIIIKRTSAK
jgi:predicted transcriptional regulator